MRYFKTKNGLTNTEVTPVNFLTTNLRYEIDGLHFDAAVDINWEMHAYDEERYKEENWKNTTAIELYCFDRPDWDIRMIYQSTKNNLCRTFVNIQNIFDETKKWIEEMKDSPVEEDEHND